ncbi:MAG TPA: rhomboid family intramembrane serine protease [Candidatus Acidoferrales bacterium]|nr:rhomboid family intramembrane serine protease [Candidatus Acidoferrales bacterium]
MDYSRRSYGYRFNWDSLLTPAIKVLLIATTAVFLVQKLLELLAGEGPALIFIHFLGLVPFAVLHGFIWQLFTYLFLHGSLLHLLLNMFVLWMFGRDLELYWGRRRFYVYYFLTGIGAGIINVAVKGLLYSPSSRALEIPTIGASGAIYGILLAAAMVFPDRQILLIPFPVTLPMRAYVAVIGAIEFFATLGATGDNISHISHLGGMLVGYLYLRRGSFFYGLRNQYSDWKRRRLRRKFDVYMRQHKDDSSPRPDRWLN